jgi:ATP-dependent RNA circularization protein (DNA/RNA ligase family)
MLEDLAAQHRQVVLFGEIYGSKIQSLDYGHKGTMGYRAFDLLIDGHYLSWPGFTLLCAQYCIDTVPIVASIPFSLDTIKKHSEGNTLLMDDNAHIREGVVVKPLQERRDPKLGRCILKYVSDQYLFGKQSDYTDR